MFGLGMTEILVLLVLGVLLFGKRLPEVGRSVGKMIVDFKKSMSGFEESLQSGDFSNYRQEAAPPPAPVRPPQRIAPSGQKFEDTPPAPSSPIV
jgi:sec-independent protein translocase protein TatA